MIKNNLVFKPNTLYFVPLGGCGEIGMNLNLYGYNDQWIIIDCGLTFNKGMGVDLVIPDYSFVTQIKNKLIGMVLTHAHEDHIGGIEPIIKGFPNLKMYATPFTTSMIKNKLRNNKNALMNCVEVPLNAKWSLGEFSIELINITHSIPEANMLLLGTPVGNLLHTGDWKFDHAPVLGAKSDMHRIKDLGPVLSVISDSTNVMEPGTAGSEQEVQDNLLSCVQKYSDARVFMVCFASNVARLESAAIIAKKTGRQLIVAGRSLHRVDEAARNAGYLQNYPKFNTDMDNKDLKDHEVLFICTGSQGEEKSVLTRMARGEHDNIKLKEGDVVIFSSRVIPGNEESINEVKNLLVSRGVILATSEDFLHVSGHPCQDDLTELYTIVKPKSGLPVHGEIRHLLFHAELFKKMGIKSIAPINGDIIEIRPDGDLVVVDKIEAGRLGIDGKTLLPLGSVTWREREILSKNGAVFVTLIRKMAERNSLANDPKEIGDPYQDPNMKDSEESDQIKNDNKYQVKINIVGLLHSTSRGNKINIINNCVEEIKNKILRSSNNPQVTEDLVKRAVIEHFRARYGKHPMVVVHVFG